MYLQTFNTIAAKGGVCDTELPEILTQTDGQKDTHIHRRTGRLITVYPLDTFVLQRVKLQMIIDNKLIMIKM